MGSRRRTVRAGEPMIDRDGRGRFLTGNSGGGRPRGARNKLSEDFLEALAGDFQAHGCAVIERVREEYPHYYLKVVATLMPKHVDAKVINNRSIHEFSDRELLEMIVDGGAGDLSLEMRDALRDFKPTGSRPSPG